MAPRLTYWQIVLAFATFIAVSPAPTFAAAPRSADELKALREQARAHEHGEGVAKDPQLALKLYCQAARDGDADAQYDMGWMYSNGRGVPRDDGLAAYYFQLAATQGHAPSIRMLRFVGPPVTEVPECMRPDPVETEAFFDEQTLNDRQRNLVDLIRKLAPDFGVDPMFALAIAWTESNLNPGAVSSKNAQGLMQLIPETSARFNVRKPFDPEQNVRGGLAYLRWLLSYFRGEVMLVAAAYNAGEGAVNRYLGVPPYAETRDYVRKILGAFRRDRHPFDETVTTPSPEIEKILRKLAKTAS